MNHVSPAALTRLARNPELNIPELDKMTTTADITCRACMEGKIARAPHKRTAHKYEKGQVFSSDIMGPLNVPGMPRETERYFLSFLDAATRYA